MSLKQHMIISRLLASASESNQATRVAGWLFVPAVKF